MKKIFSALCLIMVIIFSLAISASAKNNKSDYDIYIHNMQNFCNTASTEITFPNGETFQAIGSTNGHGNGSVVNLYNDDSTIQDSISHYGNGTIVEYLKRNDEGKTVELGTIKLITHGNGNHEKNTNGTLEFWADEITVTGIPMTPLIPATPIEPPIEPEREPEEEGGLPSEPVTPIEPEEEEIPSEPVTPIEPEEEEIPSEPVTPTEPEEEEIPSEPVTPIEPEDEGDLPSEPVTPIESEEEEEEIPSVPAIPSEPVTPYSPATPVIPMKPSVSIEPEEDKVEDIEIFDSFVPKASLPEAVDGQEEPEEIIEDDQVPLAAVPQTGESSIFYIAIGLMLLSGIALFIFGLTSNKKII